MKTDMDARNEEKKKEKETSTHTTIEKELYICALTNLPEQHTMAASQAYSIFHLSVILLRIFFCRECH